MTLSCCKVVDASALAALLFGEPEAELVAGQLANARLALEELAVDHAATLELARAYASSP